MTSIRAVCRGKRCVRNSLHVALRALSPLHALGAALARCWPILVLTLLAPAALALSAQGRQALLVAAQNVEPGLVALWIYGTALLAIGIYPMMLLDSVRSRAAATKAWQYAKYTVPQLIAATACYGLPLLLRYLTNIELDVRSPAGQANAGLGGILVMLEFIAPAAVIVPMALMMQPAASAQRAQAIASLFAIGIVFGLALIFTDGDSVFTRYLLLIAAILIVNAYFSAAYLLAHARRRWLKSLTLVLLILAAIMVWIGVRLAVAPGDGAAWWGPFGVVLIAMLSWLSLAYIIDWVIWRLSLRALFRVHPAALGALRIAVFGFIAWRLMTGAFGNATVATLPVPAEPPRAALTTYLDDWLRTRETEASGKPYPVFIVTAEGGGIRAAYWTAGVLAALHDAHPRFADHVLALSGVSGGSMGASVYAALAMDSNTALACKREGGAQGCARAIGSADLLSAPLAAMLLSEPFNRITARIGGADRAVALDQALEHAWRNTMGDDRFAAPFGEVAARRMLVLPNATSAASAQRLVITPLKADTEFENAQVLDGRAFTFSTATLLSARFPGLSPAGVLKDQEDKSGFGKALRIVDGGYADNSGTATGADVLKALTEAIDRAKGHGRFRPVVIAISNGSELTSRSFIDDVRTTTLGLLLDPVITLESVRGSVSKRFEAALRAQVVAQEGEYLNVRLLHSDAELPLGWMLAPATTNIIDKRLGALGADEKSDFNRVGALLALPR